MPKKNQPTGTYDPETGAFTPAPAKKKKWPWILAAFLAFCVIFNLANGANDKKEPAAADAEETEAAPAEGKPAETEPETEKPSSGGWLSSLLGGGKEKEEEPEDPDHVKSGQYTVEGVKLFYFDYVTNDVTGNWRIATCADNTPPADIARELSETFKQKKGEVLWIVNFTLNTTTRINHLGAYLEATTLEHVEGEEHDAKALGGGDVYTTEQIFLTEAAP